MNTLPYNQSYNQKLKYNYKPANEYNPKTHKFYGSVSQVLHLLKNKNNLTIAEIGVFRGESSLALFNYCDIKTAYLIDPFDKEIADSFNSTDGTNVHLNDDLFEQTTNALKPFENRIVYLREVSNTAHVHIPDESLDFIFIDGCHTYECVYRDLTNYIPKVKKGGIVSGDDFSNKFSGFGILEAVNDVLSDLGYEEIDVYKHSYKPTDYYSAFAFEKL